jgi:hypothetical protein
MNTKAEVDSREPCGEPEFAVLDTKNWYRAA